MTTNEAQPTNDYQLTCERCQHEWLRRNLNKLPKSCPSCHSPYWQKPLTPYWKEIRKRHQAAKVATTQTD